MLMPILRELCRQNVCVIINTCDPIERDLKLRVTYGFGVGERAVNYKKEALAEIELAYTITIHES
jgi:hypothetical protein